MAEGSDRREGAGSDEAEQVEVLPQHEVTARLIEDLCRDLIDGAGMDKGAVFAGLMLCAANATSDAYGAFTASRLFAEISKTLRADVIGSAQVH